MAERGTPLTKSDKSDSDKADTKTSTSKRTTPGVRGKPARLGGWRDGEGVLYEVTYTCDACGTKDEWRLYSYNPRQHCCNCGLQMRVERKPCAGHEAKKVTGAG